MKLNKYIYGVALGALTLTVASCYNSENEFPDYEGGTTAYFAYQDPVRTLVLGTDINDNTLDNEHKCQIWATMGGAYKGRDAVVDIVVDESLCNNLFFPDAGGNAANPVLPMPASYYKLASNTINYNGNHRGYVEVQFTDAFFNDEKSISNNYVIPLRMTGVKGIDQILSGTPRDGVETPARTNAEDWNVLPMDYVLYCVKYMNPWQGKYIRRGADVVTENGATTTFIRKDMSLVNSDLEHYTENPVNQNDEVCGITTVNMKQALFPVSLKRNASDASIPFNLILTFDGDKCTISTDDVDVTATGTGEYIINGTDKSEYKDYQWGSMNGKPVSRDILRLSYQASFKKGKYLGKDKDGKDILLANDVQVSTNDTLVVQTREANKKEFSSPKYVK